MKIRWKYQPKPPFRGWSLTVQVEDYDHVITVRTLFSSNVRPDRPPPYAWVKPIALQLGATAEAALVIAATVA